MNINMNYDEYKCELWWIWILIMMNINMNYDEYKYELWWI